MTVQHARRSPRSHFRSAVASLALCRVRGERGRRAERASGAHLAGDPGPVRRPCVRVRRSRPRGRDLHAGHGAEPAAWRTTPCLPGECREPSRGAWSGSRQGRYSSRAGVCLGGGLPSRPDAEWQEGSRRTRLLSRIGFRAGASCCLCSEASDDISIRLACRSMFQKARVHRYMEESVGGQNTSERIVTIRFPGFFVPTSSGLRQIG